METPHISEICVKLVLEETIPNKNEEEIAISDDELEQIKTADGDEPEEPRSEDESIHDSDVEFYNDESEITEEEWTTEEEDSDAEPVVTGHTRSGVKFTEDSDDENVMDEHPDDEHEWESENEEEDDEEMDESGSEIDDEESKDITDDELLESE